MLSKQIVSKIAVVVFFAFAISLVPNAVLASDTNPGGSGGTLPEPDEGNGSWVVMLIGAGALVGAVYLVEKKLRAEKIKEQEENAKTEATEQPVADEGEQSLLSPAFEQPTGSNLSFYFDTKELEGNQLDERTWKMSPLDRTFSVGIKLSF